MRCPHCQTAFHGNPTTHQLGRKDRDGSWGVISNLCPTCNRMVVDVVCGTFTGNGEGEHYKSFNSKKYRAYPRTASRPVPAAEVPKEFSEDYVEASLVLADSPKASAGLSRRCLQHVLRDAVGVKRSDLANEIEQVIDEKRLPSHLLGAVDAVRNIGNFAAHPIKSTASGEVVPVEPGEAEWNLDVLDGLFDFLFVQPALLKKRRAALDAKLAEAGKPPMK